MDDFKNSNTPEQSGDYDMQPQQPAEQNTESQPQAAEQPFADEQPQQAAEQQPTQEQPAQEPAAQQPEEPRTPYQTPVQHPEYQPPRADAFDAAPQPSQTVFGGEQPPMQPPKKKKHGKAVAIGLCSVAAACLLFAGGALIGHLVSGDGGSAVSASASTGDTPTVQISSVPELDPDNYDVVNGLAGEEIYKKVSPSIVSVISTTASGVGSGSGVIMSSDGYIITNQHVVVDADQVTVQLSDGTQLQAEVVGMDEQSDLAVLKVEPESELTAAEFGDSDALQPGEYAYAIGSPGGVQFANTITGGRISAINRDVTINDRVMTLIQTDASINPGNSGGALINKYGQVVGITSAKLSSSAFSDTSIEGMGFAIPINNAKEIVDELIANGYVAGRPSLGITGRNLTAQEAMSANVPQGVYVYSVDERANAANEGLLAGDIITAVEGNEITTMDEINAVKEEMKAGDKLDITVYRMSAGKFIDLTITLTDQHDLSDDSTATQSETGQGQGENGYSQYDQNPFYYFFGR